VDYNTQIYWVFGLCPSSCILETRKHSVSETGSLSEKLCFLVLEYRTMDKLRKPNNCEDITEVLQINLMYTEVFIHCEGEVLQNTKQKLHGKS
jgi:hypothetical protein